MKRFFSLFLVLLCLFSVVSCDFFFPDTGSSPLSRFKTYLLALNSTANNVQVIDCSTASLLSKTIPVLNQQNSNPAPQQLVDGGNGLFYVVNSLMNSLSEFDLNFNFVRELKLAAGTNPYNAVSDGAALYVSGYASGKIARINIANATVTYSAVLAPGLQAVALFGTDKLIAVSTNYNSTTYGYDPSIVYILNRNTLAKLGEFQVSEQGMTDIQNIAVHDGNVVDLFASGNAWGSGQDSGVVRISLDIPLAGPPVGPVVPTIVGAVLFPDAENIGAVARVYGDYAYFTVQTELCRVKLDTGAPVVQRDPLAGYPVNQSVPKNLSAITVVADSASDTVKIGIIDAEWTKCRIIYLEISSIASFDAAFGSLSFASAHVYSTGGYPVDLRFRMAY